MMNDHRRFKTSSAERDAIKAQGQKTFLINTSSQMNTSIIIGLITHFFNRFFGKTIISELKYPNVTSAAASISLIRS
ncbi:hypothetical protein BTA30_20120 [Bacillus swezeyi]|nr:hypothetical protein BTA30_20120 [Bacillus swezeyi]